MEFIGVLCLILVSVTLASHFSRRIGIPAVIGQLLVGILLGNGGLRIVHPDILVKDFSEIGVILLMFLAGIESNLPKVFSAGSFRCLAGHFISFIIRNGERESLRCSNKPIIFLRINFSGDLC